MLNLDAISRNLFGSVSSRDVRSPRVVAIDKSEVDLHARLDLARKNSSMAAWSPSKAPRSPSPVEASLEEVAVVPQVRNTSPDRFNQPLSPRLHGPRPPIPKSPLNTTVPLVALTPRYPPLGHKNLRVASGARKVSPGTDLIPLQDGISPRRVSNKRNHSADLLQPRKRSDSRSPLQPIELDQIRPPAPLEGKDVVAVDPIQDLRQRVGAMVCKI